MHLDLTHMPGEIYRRRFTSVLFRVTYFELQLTPFGVVFWCVVGGFVRGFGFGDCACVCACVRACVRVCVCACVFKQKMSQR